MAWKKAYVWNGTAWDAIGNQAVATLDDYALLSPSVTQTIENSILDAPAINVGTISSASVSAGSLNSASVNNAYMLSPTEKIEITTDPATGTINFYAKNYAILYSTASATGDWTLNVRANGTTNLNTIMSVGQTITVTYLTTQGATAYCPTALTIDGNAQTVFWGGGIAPTSGNTDSLDGYTYSIIKTANATFTVLGGKVQFK